MLHANEIQSKRLFVTLEQRTHAAHLDFSSFLTNCQGRATEMDTAVYTGVSWQLVFGTYFSPQSLRKHCKYKHQRVDFSKGSLSWWSTASEWLYS